MFPIQLFLETNPSTQAKLIPYRFLAPGMDDVHTQDTIPIHFPQFQPSLSQTQLDNNGQPLPPQLRDSTSQHSDNTITFSNSS